MRDLSAEDANAIEMHKAWVERSGDKGEDLHIRAGTAGAYLAKVWKCSEAEAFNIALRLMKAGRFRFHLHQWSYAFEFSPETLNATSAELKAVALVDVPKVTAALERFYKTGEWSGVEDRWNRSPVVALFVAFGRLVTGDDFELYPAPRAN
jgi:hypothetical protein